ncbi:TraI domain-containing protein [Yersinia enterocolitica]|uniref:TraI domain-containing protein n=1 Tax=Yersinia enterocolitica TaxID=630 RepID=UPI0005E7B470|nr:TraI domain-containing protein [Yersinia enterocolitica]EKN4722022.1 TraI domain-containing protein [Yersinia enterocolitica]EKN4734154.1 TraI domain-containing protein [Yersinia enterocolitica]CQJ32253.1 helicase [Yersinia enterocolitica]
MLKSLLKLLPTSIGKREEKVSISAASVPDGYHEPEQAAKLLASPQRRQWLQTLWDYSSLPKDLYLHYYLQPLEHCVTLMQQFPATESGHHAYLGGMVDHLLETVAYAARLSKNHLLPIGAQPEDQASQSAAWNAVIVYAAMLQSLDRLCQIEVELESGQRWMPLNAMPSEPYRFRFKPVVEATQAQSLGAMLAWKVIPDEALLWLSTWPEVLKTLSLYLTGFRNESGIINTIASEAISTSIGKEKGVPEIATAISASIPPVVLEAIMPLEKGSLHSASSPVLLSSSLPVESPLSEGGAISLDSTLPDSETVEPAFPEEDTTGDLLAVMGFSAPINLAQDVQVISMQTETVLKEDIDSSDSMGIGERFWQWLSEGCCSGTFAVNTTDARIYIIAGYVFIRTPNIFHQFLSESCENSEAKTSLQSAFERLGRHRQDKGVMYTCHVYQDKAKEGRFQKMTGYLIVAKKLYKDHSIPGDNPLVMIKP